MRSPTIAALAALALACSDAPTTPRPGFELVDPGLRVTTVNAHVYGSFSVAAGGGVIRSGPANFPGRPKGGPGTCQDGLWINAQGKPTSGSLAKPHPHCFSPSAAIEVVLEPISACYGGVQDKVEEPAPPAEGEEAPAEPAPAAEPPKPGAGVTCKQKATKKGATVAILILTNEADGNGTVEGTSYDAPELGTSNTQGFGTIVGYAIEASTLGTTNKRVGTLTIDLGQYTNEAENYLHFNGQPGCNVDETIESPCFNKVITARYNPLPAAQGGIGPVDFATEGFLWVMPADSPYNYTE
jgi:hypothetical protein